MTELTIPASERFFFYGAHRIRYVMEDDAPWFVAADVFAALGVQSYRDQLRKLDPDERGVGKTYTPGGTQEVQVISEPGLYKTVLRSRDAVTPGTHAHAFMRWVTHDLIPTIRRQELEQPQEASEAAWFADRPHWEPIRTLALQGLPMREIAEAVGRSPGSVRHCIHRMVRFGLIRETQRSRIAFRRRKRMRPERQLSLRFA